jgi:hypothetical protein
VIQPGGTRVGELRPWMTAELAKDGGDVKATWARLKDADLQITDWRGNSAFVFPDRRRHIRLHPDRAWPRNRVVRRSHRQPELPSVGRR